MMEHTENCFQLLLEGVVEKSWKFEEGFHKALFKKQLKRNDNLCQGICRQVVSMLGDVFDDVRTVSIKVKGQTHLIIFVDHAGYDFIVDGTIKQFKPKINKTVWRFKDYPFQKELKKSETWTIVEAKK